MSLNSSDQPQFLEDDRQLLKQLYALVLDMKDDMQKVQTRLSNLEGSRDTVGRLDKLTAVVYELRQEVTELRQEVTELRQEVTELRQEVTELRKDVNQLRQDFNQLRKDVDKNTQGLEETRLDLKSLRESFEQFRQETNQNFEEIRTELKYKYLEIVRRQAFDEYTLADLQQQFEKFIALPDRVSELEKAILK